MSRAPLPERAGGPEPAQLLAPHFPGDVHAHMAAAVMHGEGVADEFGEDRGAAAPGLQDDLFALLIHFNDSLHQLRLNEGSFFNASAHDSLLLSVYLSLMRFTISLSELLCFLRVL